MQPVAVPIAALKSALAAEVVLRMGATFGARVVERHGDHGLLLLAGAPLVAKLPPELVAGQALRLRVAAVGAEQVELQVVAPDAQAQAPAAATPTPTALPVVALPGGLQARLLVDADGGGGGGEAGRARGLRGLTLRVDSPVLGRLDLRLESGACAVHVAAGEPAQRVRASVPELQRSLSTATGRPVQVTVHPRLQAVDLRG